jgi:hypothetical protein
MKNTKILSIVLAAAMLVAVPANAWAAEEETLPKAGITPDSAFYWGDRWAEQVSLAFSNGEGKVQKALQYAGERLAELNEMAAENKVKAMEKASEGYQNCLEIATQNMEKAMEKGGKTASQVATRMANHIARMQQTQAGENEDCGQIRMQTRQMSQDCQENSIEILAGQDPEEALKLGVQLMNQECEGIRNRIGQIEDSEVEECLQEYERLRTMNQAMLARAEQNGEGLQAQQMVGEALANQNQVLNQVATQLQTLNQGISETPLQNQVQQQVQLNNQFGDGEGIASGTSGETGGTSEASQSYSPRPQAGGTESGNTDSGSPDNGNTSGSTGDGSGSSSQIGGGNGGK